MLTIGFIALMRKYPGACSLIACINLTLIAFGVDLTLGAELL